MAEICHLGSWRQNAKMRFSQKLSILQLWCLLMTYRFDVSGLFKEPIIGSIKSKMAEMRTILKIDMTSFFSAEDKISETGAEWYVDCGDWSKSQPVRIPIWQTFGRIQRHVIPEPPATLQGAATWWIHCHDSRATCHIAGCSHLTKSMSWSCYIAGCKKFHPPYWKSFFAIFIYFCF